MSNQIEREPLKIGFMDKPFPVKVGSKTKSKSYNLNCRGYNVDVKVHQCKLLSGDIEFSGIITSHVKISDKLFAGGFGSHCYADESETMKEAVKLYCEDHNLQLCNTYCNWPYFRGHVKSI